MHGVSPKGQRVLPPPCLQPNRVQQNQILWGRDGAGCTQLQLLWICQAVTEAAHRAGTQGEVLRVVTLCCVHRGPVTLTLVTTSQHYCVCTCAVPTNRAGHQPQHDAVLANDGSLGADCSPYPLCISRACVFNQLRARTHRVDAQNTPQASNQTWSWASYGVPHAGGGDCAGGTPPSPAQLRPCMHHHHQRPGQPERPACQLQRQQQRCSFGALKKRNDG
jgi:hypothetical protein